jgi:hypothetical protein
MLIVVLEWQAILVEVEVSLGHIGMASHTGCVRAHFKERAKTLALFLECIQKFANNARLVS